MDTQLLTLEAVIAMCPEPYPVHAICPECQTPYTHCRHHTFDPDNMATWPDPHRRFQ